MAASAIPNDDSFIASSPPVIPLLQQPALAEKVPDRLGGIDRNKNCFSARGIELGFRWWGGWRCQATKRFSESDFDSAGAFILISSCLTPSNQKYRLGQSRLSKARAGGDNNGSLACYSGCRTAGPGCLRLDRGGNHGGVLHRRVSVRQVPRFCSGPQRTL